MRREAVQVYLDRQQKLEERSRLNEMAKALGYVSASGRPNLSAMFRAWAKAANTQLGFSDDLFRQIQPGNPNFNREAEP